MKSINIALFTILITGLSLAQPGSITNINSAQRTDGSMIVDIFYDLDGPDPQYIITTEASFNGGTNFSMLSQVTGDAGAGIPTGTGKHIVWNFGAEFPGSYSPATKIRLRAYLNDCFYFTDNRDGKEYSTIQIGAQCWMAENLNIGTLINGNIDQSNNGTIEKYCYSDLNSNCVVYGGLYQWDEMMQYTAISGTQGICPEGWHLPSDAEYATLTNFLGGNSIAGGAMKEAGTTHWAAPNTGATNSSGFTGLPGGRRSSNGTYTQIGGWAGFWTSTEYVAGGNTHSVDISLIWNDDDAIYSPLAKTYGGSVRCLQNN